MNGNWLMRNLKITNLIMNKHQKKILSEIEKKKIIRVEVPIGLGKVKDK